jgi:hypothetical protein
MVRYVFVVVCIGWALSTEHASMQSRPWTPPIGVPPPGFGINERAPASPSPWTAETPRFYFVDNTHPNASDDAERGTPVRPRKSIPAQVEAGAVVEVHGGPYVHASDWSWGGTGTREAPIFYRGVGAPKVQGDDGRSGSPSVYVAGSYVVVEGFDFVNSPVRLNGSFLGLRQNEVRDRPPRRGGAGVYAGSSKDTVIIGNHIHHNGDPNYYTENDLHGVQVASGASRVWIVDNHMHHNGGDSVQVNSGRGTMARFIYIGRNEMHDEGENAVDIKTAEDVVISQNHAYRFKPTNFQQSGSDGTAIVINDDNMLNRKDNRLWILFNRIHDSATGVRTQAHASVIGNAIYDVVNGVVSFGSHSVLIEHNTFNGIGTAVARSGGAAGFSATIVNNVILNRKTADFVIRGNSARTSIVRHNVVRNSEGPSAAGEVPRPAIDEGEPSEIYATYQTLYGVSIAVDFEGRPRPANRRAWDAGAYEAGAESTTATR